MLQFSYDVYIYLMLLFWHRYNWRGGGGYNIWMLLFRLRYDVYIGVVILIAL